MLKEIVYISVLLFVTFASGIRFTGDVAKDFSANLNNAVVRINDYAPGDGNGYDVSMPNELIQARFLVSGYDIEFVAFYVDHSASALHIGIECFGICGDADGDNDSGRTSKALSDLGGQDSAAFAQSESALVAFDFADAASGAPDGELDFVIGYPGAASAGDRFPCPPAYDVACFGLFRYSDGLSLTKPQERFSWQVDDAALGESPTTHAVDHNPLTNFTSPHLEWSIIDFNRFLANAGFATVNEVGFVFNVLVYLGDAAGIGEDCLRSCTELTAVTFPCELVDVCDVCEGDGTSCLDCAGVPNGPIMYDECGICNGDNKACADCEGTANGDATYDACGVCGGNGSQCTDCAGVINGDAQYNADDVCITRIPTAAPTLPPERSISFTGNVRRDFHNELRFEVKNVTDVNDANKTYDVTVNDDMKEAGLEVSGWDIEYIAFYHDPEADTLSIGISCWVICGDADGDGVDGRTSETMLGLGGEDLPNFQGSESSLVAFDFGGGDNGEPDGKLDFIIGYPAFEALGSDWFPAPCNRSFLDINCFGLYRYQGNDYLNPHNSFLWVNDDDALQDSPQFRAIDHNPQPSMERPGLEWTITSLSSLLKGESFQEAGVGEWSFGFLAFQGSFADDGTGEEFMPANDVVEIAYKCRLYDVCDVCGGNGDSCLDCAGLPNGPSVYDACDVCGGDGQSCADCLGIPNGEATYDVCLECNGDGLVCRDCLQVPFGTAEYDRCGVCAGNGDTCVDCAGALNGTAYYDERGVCITPSPTRSPTLTPTKAPTRTPTPSPSRAPTVTPTKAPTGSPTFTPTLTPSRTPTQSPTLSPTFSPTLAPIKAPTGTPTTTPTKAPSKSPTPFPSGAPTASPTNAPSLSPTKAPTKAPSLAPTRAPSQSPTMAPSQSPSPSPTFSPTLSPTPFHLCGNNITEFSEQCDGNGPCCGSDCQFLNTTTQCRASKGVCDEEEFCSGSSANCPPDALSPSTKLCRDAAHVCDAKEFCTGSLYYCPPNANLTVGAACDDGAACTGYGEQFDEGDQCSDNGICGAPFSLNCECQEDSDCETLDNPCARFQCAQGRCIVSAGNASAICRNAKGLCDIVERCTGNSTQCPEDNLLPRGAVCRQRAGFCDVAEECDGASPFCAIDLKQSTDFVCRPAQADLPCDFEERCDGIANDCPFDAVLTSGAICRPSKAPCDKEEICDGFNFTCPPDMAHPYGTKCDDGIPCTINDQCRRGNYCMGTYDSESEDCRCFGDDDAICFNGDPCTSWNCENGRCIYEPLPESTPCDDSLECTPIDRCDGNGVCVTLPLGAECDASTCNLEFGECCGDSCLCTTPTRTGPRCDIVARWPAGHYNWCGPSSEAASNENSFDCPRDGDVIVYPFYIEDEQIPHNVSGDVYYRQGYSLGMGTVGPNGALFNHGFDSYGIAGARDAMASVSFFDDATLIDYDPLSTNPERLVFWFASAVQFIGMRVNFHISNASQAPSRLRAKFYSDTPPTFAAPAGSDDRYADISENVNWQMENMIRDKYLMRARERSSRQQKRQAERERAPLVYRTEVPPDDSLQAFYEFSSADLPSGEIVFDSWGTFAAALVVEYVSGSGFSLIDLAIARPTWNESDFYGEIDRMEPMDDDDSGSDEDASSGALSEAAIVAMAVGGCLLLLLLCALCLCIARRRNSSSRLSSSSSSDEAHDAHAPPAHSMHSHGHHHSASAHSVPPAGGGSGHYQYVQPGSIHPANPYSWLSELEHRPLHGATAADFAIIFAYTQSYIQKHKTVHMRTASGVEDKADTAELFLSAIAERGVILSSLIENNDTMHTEFLKDLRFQLLRIRASSEAPKSANRASGSVQSVAGDAAKDEQHIGSALDAQGYGRSELVNWYATNDDYPGPPLHAIESSGTSGIYDFISPEVVRARSRLTESKQNIVLLTGLVQNMFDELGHEEALFAPKEPLGWRTKERSFVKADQAHEMERIDDLNLSLDAMLANGVLPFEMAQTNAVYTSYRLVTPLTARQHSEAEKVFNLLLDFERKHIEVHDSGSHTALGSTSANRSRRSRGLGATKLSDEFESNSGGSSAGAGRPSRRKNRSSRHHSKASNRGGARQPHYAIPKSPRSPRDQMQSRPIKITVSTLSSPRSDSGYSQYTHKTTLTEEEQLRRPHKKKGRSSRKSGGAAAREAKQRSFGLSLAELEHVLPTRASNAHSTDDVVAFRCAGCNAPVASSHENECGQCGMPFDCAERMPIKQVAGFEAPKVSRRRCDGCKTMVSSKDTECYVCGMPL